MLEDVIKEYSIEDWAELVQTKFAGSQASARASIPDGLVGLSANEVWTNKPNLIILHITNGPHNVFNEHSRSNP